MKRHKFVEDPGVSNTMWTTFPSFLHFIQVCPRVARFIHVLARSLTSPTRRDATGGSRLRRAQLPPAGAAALQGGEGPQATDVAPAWRWGRM